MKPKAGPFPQEGREQDSNLEALERKVFLKGNRDAVPGRRGTQSAVQPVGVPEGSLTLKKSMWPKQLLPSFPGTSLKLYLRRRNSFAVSYYAIILCTGIALLFSKHSRLPYLTWASGHMSSMVLMWRWGTRPTVVLRPSQGQSAGRALSPIAQRELAVI